jgi:hypothetical protein
MNQGKGERRPGRYSRCCYVGDAMGSHRHWATEHALIGEGELRTACALMNGFILLWLRAYFLIGRDHHVKLRQCWGLCCAALSSNWQG